MSIAQRITARWPDTERAVEQKHGATYLAARERAIEDALALLYAPLTPPAPATITDPLLEQDIADRAVLALIPMARDVLMQERVQESQAQEYSGSITTRWHDKPGGLDTLARDLQAEIAGRRAYLTVLIHGEQPPARGPARSMSVRTRSWGV